MDWKYEDSTFGDSENQCYSVGVLCSEELFRKNNVAIYKTCGFGNALYIDDSLQCTEKDHHYYSEFIVHAPMQYRGFEQPKSILVIGGGDGGTISELLKYEIDFIDWVEINESVIEASKKYLNFFPKENSKVNLIIEDGTEYIKKCNKKYDLIIVDGHNPDGNAVPLYQFEFLSNCSEKCRIFVTNAPYHALALNFCRTLKYYLSNLYFSKVEYYQVPVSCYCGGNIGFFIANKPSNKPSLRYLPKTKWFQYNTQDACKALVGKSFVNKRRQAYDLYLSQVDQKKISQSEKAYIDKCCNLDGEPSFKGLPISNYSTSYRIKYKKFWARFAIGSSNHNLYDAAINIADKDMKVGDVIRQKFGKQINGVAWDQELNHVKFYRLCNLDSIPESFQHLCDNDIDGEIGIVSLTFDKTTEELLETKLYYVGFAQTIMITDKRGKVIQYNYSPKREDWNCRINKIGKKIIDDYKKNGIPLDTIAFENMHSYTLYFEESSWNM